MSDCVDVCECLFLMRSERASRVCIVVLEEVEEDEPCSSHPPPQYKSSRHATQRAAAQQDKVRWALLFGLLLIELDFLNLCFSGGWATFRFTFVFLYK